MTVIVKNGVEECSRFRVHSLLSILSDLILSFFSLKILEHACGGGIREDTAIPLQTPWFTI
jgi:hypothetical protein